MKNLTVVGLLMLGIGFGIGWLAKPVPALPKETAVLSKSSEGKPSVVAAEHPAADSPPAGKRVIRVNDGKKPADAPTAAQMDQAKKMQAEMSKAMTGRMRGKFEARIERLAESLSLTAEQKAELTTWLDGRMKEIESLDFSDPAAMSHLSGDGLSEKALDQQLAASLSAEQKEELEAFKGRERSAKVDTAALKSLSKLQGIIQFEEGQRDEVYKILTAGAEAGVDAAEEKPDFTQMFTENMGIEMDPYDLGLTQVLGEVMGGSMNGGIPGDQKEMAKNLRETFDKRIDEKVEKLRPVLNDKQLDAYRGELKSKGLGIYGQMLMGMEDGTD